MFSYNPSSNYIEKSRKLNELNRQLFNKNEHRSSRKEYELSEFRNHQNRRVNKSRESLIQSDCPSTNYLSADRTYQGPMAQIANNGIYPADEKKNYGLYHNSLGTSTANNSELDSFYSASNSNNQQLNSSRNNRPKRINNLINNENLFLTRSKTDLKNSSIRNYRAERDREHHQNHQQIIHANQLQDINRSRSAAYVPSSVYNTTATEEEILNSLIIQSQSQQSNASPVTSSKKSILKKSSSRPKTGSNYSRELTEEELFRYNLKENTIGNGKRGKIDGTSSSSVVNSNHNNKMILNNNNLYRPKGIQKSFSSNAVPGHNELFACGDEYTTYSGRSELLNYQFPNGIGKNSENLQNNRVLHQVPNNQSIKDYYEQQSYRSSPHNQINANKLNDNNKIIYTTNASSYRDDDLTQISKLYNQGNHQKSKKELILQKLKAELREKEIQAQNGNMQPTTQDEGCNNSVYTLSSFHTNSSSVPSGYSDDIKIEKYNGISANIYNHLRKSTGNQTTYSQYTSSSGHNIIKPSSLMNQDSIILEEPHEIITRVHGHTHLGNHCDRNREEENTVLSSHSEMDECLNLNLKLNCTSENNTPVALGTKTVSFTDDSTVDLDCGASASNILNSRLVEKQSLSRKSTMVFKQKQNRQSANVPSEKSNRSSHKSRDSDRSSKEEVPRKISSTTQKRRSKDLDSYRSRRESRESQHSSLQSMLVDSPITKSKENRRKPQMVKEKERDRVKRRSKSKEKDLKSKKSSEDKVTSSAGDSDDSTMTHVNNMKISKNKIKNSSKSLEHANLQIFTQKTKNAELLASVYNSEILTRKTTSHLVEMSDLDCSNESDGYKPDQNSDGISEDEETETVKSGCDDATESHDHDIESEGPPINSNGDLVFNHKPMKKPPMLYGFLKFLINFIVFIF